MRKLITFLQNHLRKYLVSGQFKKEQILINEEKKVIMANLKDKGNEYAQYLKDTFLIKYQSIVDIENKIDNLSYKESGKKISKSDKLNLIEFIKEGLNKDINLNESESVDSLLELINDLKNKIDNG